MSQKKVVSAVALAMSCALIALAAGCGGAAHRSDPVFADRDYDIYLAAEAGDVQGVRQFLMAGEWDFQLFDVSGGTPLHSAAKGGSPEIIQMMLQMGADVNVPDTQGRTPLAVALREGNEEAAQVLRQFGGQE